MAGGTYKNGVAIDLVYQAAALLSNAIPDATVYDEGDALDTVKSTGLTSSLLAGALSGVAIGSYRGSFTPDAEGPWTVIIEDKNNAGQVSKIYNVAGHDLDSVGDLVTALDTADTTSQLLITKSAIVSSILVDCNASTSDVKSAVIAQTSDVKSAVTVVSGYAASGATAAALSDVESAVNVAVSAIALVSSAAMVS